MGRTEKIYEDDLIAKEHFPIKAMFNMVSDDRFKEVIRGLSENCGFGENYGACLFWNNDLDDYDKANTPYYEGAEFGLHDGSEIIVGYNVILYYMRLACERYCAEYPDDSDEINEYIRRFIERNSL